MLSQYILLIPFQRSYIAESSGHDPHTRMYNQLSRLSLHLAGLLSIITNLIDKILTFISVFLLLSKNWIGCFLTNCKNSHFHRLINPHIHRFNIKEGCEQLHSLNFTTNNLQSVGSLLKGDWQDSNLRWTNVIRATIWWNRPLSYKHHIII